MSEWLLLSDSEFQQITFCHVALTVQILIISEQLVGTEASSFTRREWVTTSLLRKFWPPTTGTHRNFLNTSSHQVTRDTSTLTTLSFIAYLRRRSRSHIKFVDFTGIRSEHDRSKIRADRLNRKNQLIDQPLLIDVEVNLNIY